MSDRARSREAADRNESHRRLMLAHLRSQEARPSSDVVDSITSQPVDIAAPYIVVERAEQDNVWLIEGPDEHRLSWEFSDVGGQEEAEQFAAELNSAWRAGLAAADDPRIPAVWRRS